MPVDPYLQELANSLGSHVAERALDFLTVLEENGLPPELLDGFVGQLRDLLPPDADAPRVVVNLQRFLGASRSTQSWLALFEREPEALATLIKLFSASQYMSELLISDPEAFDLLRITRGQPVEQRVLEDEIMAAVSACGDIRAVMRQLRDYRHRETLRIAYGDMVQGQSVETVTDQISKLAESLVAAALWAAERELQGRRPMPRHADGTPVGFAVIALGKLGGAELNYSSDIDLLFIHEDVVELAPQRSPHGASSPQETFQRLAQLLMKLLSESTNEGIVYRVDTRLRPHAEHGPLVISFSSALNYYHSVGRTWERQVFIKARAIAGDRQLGQELIQQLQPWIYSRYLMRADITGIAALKRRIENRERQAGADEGNVKDGHGGIRDIECVIQFLQLLNGGEEPSVRCTGTLEAIRRLQAAGCLTAQEQSELTENYHFLRRVEHFLQIMFDRQTHRLPDDPLEFSKLAVRIGYRDDGDLTAAESFRRELHERAMHTRGILDHLLQATFDTDSLDLQSLGAAAGTPESDLILDPQPENEVIQKVMGRHGFKDGLAAYRHLQQLAVETIPFLSTRRCRHFLAAIAPNLLAAIDQTPNPDETLINLVHVSDSLGGKAVLWELFSANPPSMHLCVRLCACSSYLTGLLTSNPGMIDELLDSLMLGSLPDRDKLAQNLEELCRNARDTAPILHSFKNSMHLRVGVRDILGRDSISQTHTALSDIAEVCMEQVIHHEFHRLIHRFGLPTSDQGAVAELVVLAVGKLGGREPNYHSDLDVIFLFNSEGSTKPLFPSRRFEPTTNRHFFNQLSQRVIHAATRIGNTGRLFEIDVRLRPLGRSGELAITIDDLQGYFSEGGGQVWERQALCKARPIWGSPEAQAAAMNCVHQVLISDPFTPESAQQIFDHRMQLQMGASPSNLKRGSGGTMDIEFVVQMLQLAHAAQHPSILVPGTLDAIERLKATSCLGAEAAEELYGHYEFLRSIESGIRLMNMSARHELPATDDGLRALAFLLSNRTPGRPLSARQLVEQCARARARCRKLFHRIFQDFMPPPAMEVA